MKTKTQNNDLGGLTPLTKEIPKASIVKDPGKKVDNRFLEGAAGMPQKVVEKKVDDEVDARNQRM